MSLIYQWGWSLLCFNKQLCVVWHPCFHLPRRPLASRWQLSKALLFFLDIDSHSHCSVLFLNPCWPEFNRWEGKTDRNSHFVFPVSLSTLLKEFLQNWMEYLLLRWYPPKPCRLMHSRVPFSLLFFSLFSAFTVDFLSLSLCASLSQFALSAGNLLKVCVCLCIRFVRALACLRVWKVSKGCW